MLLFYRRCLLLYSLQPRLVPGSLVKFLLGFSNSHPMLSMAAPTISAHMAVWGGHRVAGGVLYCNSKWLQIWSKSALINEATASPLYTCAAAWQGWVFCFRGGRVI